VGVPRQTPGKNEAERPYLASVESTRSPLMPGRCLAVTPACVIVFANESIIVHEDEDHVSVPVSASTAAAASSLLTTTLNEHAVGDVDD
jgi:hypothetical protein